MRLLTANKNAVSVRISIYAVIIIESYLGMRVVEYIKNMIYMLHYNARLKPEIYY